MNLYTVVTLKQTPTYVRLINGCGGPSLSHRSNFPDTLASNGHPM